MLFQSKRELCVSAVTVLLISCTVYGFTGGSKSLREKGGAECPEGWLLSHNYCMQYTGLSEEQAEVFCVQQGALQARGICISKPSQDLSSSVPESAQPDEDELGTLAPLSSSDSEHECPRGWIQYRDFCYFRPGAVPKICALLGANYMFNYCVTRVPHLISTDFLQTVKRLDGDDYDLHRETRLCCCRGGGLCK